MSRSEEPPISVVTCCYNSVAFIRRLHASLAKQTYKNFEWVLVDDGSNDDTVSLLLELPSPGALGMRVFRLPQNSGGGVALGVAFEKAQTGIVTIVDHDDEVLDEGLHRIADEWPLAENDPSVCGLFFGRVEAGTDQTIGGELPRGKRFTMSWLTNFAPAINDGAYALKRELALAHFNPRSLEAICLNGVPFMALTQRYVFIAGGGPGIVRYHRDNPESQTNSIKISRKTVYTYASALALYDRQYLVRPLALLRHVVALVKFSTAVHGDPLFHNRYIESAPRRLISYLLAPVGIASYTLGPKNKTVHFPPYDLSKVHDLPDLRAPTAA